MTTTKPKVTGVSLKAMAEDKNVDIADRLVSKSTPTFDIDPRVIFVRPGFNMRLVDPDHVAAMVLAAKGGATFPPLVLVIEDGQPCLLDGEHRLTMYMQLIAEGMDVKRVKATEFKPNGFKPTLAQQIIFMMGCAKGKVALPLQTGTQYALLMNTCGMSYAEIATADGVSVQHVKDMIRLTQQEPEITNLIKDGTVTATTALKLVKQVGAKEAGKTLQAAAVVAKEAGKKVTQKTIDKIAPPPPPAPVAKGITEKHLKAAAKSVVKEVASRSDAVKDHLHAMLESPSITGPNRDHVKAVLALCEGKQPEAPKVQPSIADFLARNSDNDNEVISQAAGIMQLVHADKLNMIPATGSVESQDYGHRMWLEKMAEGRRKENKVMRKAAHWFIAVLNNNRTGREAAPPPSVMALDEAIQAEIDSAGAVNAAEFCPEAESLINYLRGKK